MFVCSCSYLFNECFDTHLLFNNLFKCVESKMEWLTRDNIISLLFFPLIRKTTFVYTHLFLRLFENENFPMKLFGGILLNFFFWISKAIIRNLLIWKKDKDRIWFLDKTIYQIQFSLWFFQIYRYEVRNHTKGFKNLIKKK